MNQIVPLWGKSLQLTLSERAQAQLDRRATPLLLEMELYFSCLVRKRVYVREHTNGEDAAALNEKLSVSFRPVVTQSCAMREVERDNPPVMDMPIVKPERYFPHWLTLDYRRGKWLAEFGYATAPF
jgi:hypothetical protein